VSTNSVNIRALTELSNTYMILFNIGGFLTSKISLDKHNVFMEKLLKTIEAPKRERKS